MLGMKEDWSGGRQEWPRTVEAAVGAGGEPQAEPRCEPSLGLGCPRRNPAQCTCSRPGPAGNTHGASIQWEGKVCSPPETGG